MTHLQQLQDDNYNYGEDCPSFSTYTTNSQIADIASRVVAIHLNNGDGDGDGDDDDEFEFGNMSPISFPVYPVFNRDLLRDLGHEQETSAGNPVELRKLFFEEDVSLSVDLELEGVAQDTYCLWAPKSPSLSPSPGRCMKSSSTGSGPSTSSTVSKTWRLRNLLRRCKSDGKEGLMLVSSNGVNKADKLSSPSPSRPAMSPGRGNSSKEAGGTRRKSYLPYKPDLLGFFGSPQTLRKINIPPF